MQIQTFLGDNLEILPTIPENHVHAVVTDPPYGLGNQPDIYKVIDAWMNGDSFKNGKGFMSKEWDGFVPSPATWRAVMRVMRPGAFLFAFAGTRTVGVMDLALRMAGFEIRDMISWINGEGMPTGNANVEAAVNKLGGDGETWRGYGSRLMPNLEPVIIARNPFKGTLGENVLKWGTGALHIRAGRIPREDASELYCEPKSLTRDSNRVQFQKSDKTGTMNDEYLRGGWPRNVIFAEDAMDGLPERAKRYFYCPKVKRAEREAGLEGFPHRTPSEITGRKEGSAGLEYAAAGSARCSGAKNHHPTLKPIELMRYLCRLACPEKGIILDPFMGAGSTGIAAVLEDFSFIGIEMDTEYKAIADARITHWQGERGGTP